MMNEPNQSPRQSSKPPVALITGGSGGLGLVIAQTFLRHGYRVMIVGRNPDRIEAAVVKLQGMSSAKGCVAGEVGDLTQSSSVAELISRLAERFGRLDVLINCVGASDRGLIEKLSSDRLADLLQRNVFTALLCSQAALPMLEASGGVIVNIGSLGSKVGARFIGGYAIAKHGLAGMTQQLRLELKPRGVHVALVSPGPIRREDAGTRYNDQVDETLPAQAAQPGGGTRIKGLDPQKVANAVFRSAVRRRPDVIMPGYMRLCIAFGHAFPRLGDWLLLKFTSSKQDS